MCGGAGGALAISCLAMGTVADAAEKLGVVGGYREATALATVVLWIAALSSVSWFLCCEERAVLSAVAA